MINSLDFHIDELDLMQKYPETLFYIGNTQLLQRPKISIVGTRNPFSTTRIFTENLAQKLSLAGYCIVSGGALGVDAIAHRAAGAHNTIMVSPCGLNIRYPATNKKLIASIEQEGLILSTYEADFFATPWSFVARNEIVVALGDILIVTQADLKSGSMRSVEFALKMGKKIYVLPHQINQSEGTNQLLKEGLAQAIYDIDGFIFDITGQTNRSNSDDFLEFCKTNPSYDEAIKKESEKTFLYELEGKIRVVNGTVYLA